MPRLSIIFFVVLSMLLLISGPCYSATQSKHVAKPDWNKQIGWVTVPVFYVTDRTLNVQSGELDYAELQRSDGLSYGIKNITIPFTAHLNNYAKQLKKMGWHVLSMEGQPHQRYVRSAELEFPNRTYSRDEFFQALQKAVDLSDRRELLLHIHGCCVTYKNSMVNAAKLEGWYRVPIILYDWTSPDFGPLKLPEYLRNENTVKSAEAQFYEFADALEQNLMPQQIAISAHSMGNRLLDSYLTRRFYRYGSNGDHPKLREAIFASADVGAEAFSKHTTSEAQNSRMTRIYISGQDPALAISEVVHRGEARLGRPGKVLPQLCTTDKMDLIDETELFLKHDLPDWLIANMHRYGRPGERDTYDVVQKSKHLFVIKERKHAEGKTHDRS